MDTPPVVTIPVVVAWAQRTQNGVEASLFLPDINGYWRVTIPPVKTLPKAFRASALHAVDVLETWIDNDQPLTTHREHFQPELSRAWVNLFWRHGHKILVWLRRLPA